MNKEKFRLLLSIPVLFMLFPTAITVVDYFLMETTLSIWAMLKANVGSIELAGLIGVFFSITLWFISEIPDI